MEHLSTAVERFFKEYEKNSGLENPEQLTSQYADSFMAADPGGVRVVTSAGLRAAIPQRKRLFKAIGSRSTTLVSLHETELDDQYVMVKTQWRMAFDRPDHSEEILLNSTFILHRSGEELRIVFYLTHENIMTVLRSRGLLPQTAQSE